MGFRKLLICAFTFTAIAPCSAQAADFAIETDVFQGNRQEPSATNLTIFSEGVIYDFAVKPDDRVTVLDGHAKRFVLADTRKQTQSSLTIDELIRFVAERQGKALQSDYELIRFAASPKFKSTYNEQTGQLNLSSEHWDYRVETTPIADKSIGEQYGKFANWFTQLNALFRPIPPAVRMELNQQLAERKRLPVRVVVHIKQEGQATVRQESRHRLITNLTQRETQLIEDWKDRKGSCQRVPFHEFWQTQLPSPSKQR